VDVFGVGSGTADQTVNEEEHPGRVPPVEFPECPLGTAGSDGVGQFPVRQRCEVGHVI